MKAGGREDFLEELVADPQRDLPVVERLLDPELGRRELNFARVEIRSDHVTACLFFDQVVKVELNLRSKSIYGAQKAYFFIP